jgi:hypothetical protein
MVMGLSFDSVLSGMTVSEDMGRRVKRSAPRKSMHTAPYLETCRTKSDASLKRGRGTMVAIVPVLLVRLGRKSTMLQCSTCQDVF